MARRPSRRTTGALVLGAVARARRLRPRLTAAASGPTRLATRAAGARGHHDDHDDHGPEPAHHDDVAHDDDHGSGRDDHDHDQHDDDDDDVHDDDDDDSGHHDDDHTRRPRPRAAPAPRSDGPRARRRASRWSRWSVATAGCRSSGMRRGHARMRGRWRAGSVRKRVWWRRTSTSRSTRSTPGSGSLAPAAVGARPHPVRGDVDGDAGRQRFR